MTGTWITDDALVARARALWDEGSSARWIAFLIGDGCTRNAIVGAAHRRNWPPRPSPINHGKGKGAKAVPRVPDKPHRKALDVVQQAALSRRPPKPAPKSPPAVAAPEPAPEPALLRSCQWIPEQCTGRPWVFCGRPTYRGSPYCEPHWHRCYHRHGSAPAAVVVAA